MLTSPPSPICSAILWLVVALLSLTACSWSQYPDRQEAVVGPFETTLPGSSDAQRDDGENLFVTPDGIWVYRETPPESLDRGDLALATRRGEPHSGRAHLFAVVSRHVWGLRLQRLDAAPVDSRDSSPYGLQKIGGADRLGRFPGHGPSSCLVEPSSPRTSTCLTEAAVGTRWMLYPVDADGHVRVPEKPRPGVLPVPRIGFLQRTAGESAIEAIGLETTESDKWLAVAHPALHGPAPEASVAVDANCGFSPRPPNGFDVQFDEAEVPERDHPVHVEQAAYRLTADALLSCRNSNASALLPTLFRPILETLDGTPLGPPTLGHRRVPVDSAGEPTRRLVATGFAYLAAGDPALADYAFERAIRTSPGRIHERLLFGSMQVASAAGRPEAAHRRGDHALAGGWNRDNNPQFLVGSAAARAASGDSRQYYATRESAREAVERRDAPRFEAWLKWAELVVRAVSEDLNTDKLTRASNDFEGREARRWRIATRLTAARDDVDISPVSIPPLEEGRTGLAGLRAALDGEDVAQTCSKPASCRLDGYGRRLAGVLASEPPPSGDELVERLLRMAQNTFQPGIAATLRDARTRSRLTLASLAAIAPRIRGEYAADFDEVLTRRLVTTIRDRKQCRSDPPANVRRHLAIAHGRSRSPSARLRLLNWWYDGDGAFACSDPPRAARSLVALAADHTDLQPFLAPLFPVLVERADSNLARRSVVERAAEFAAEHDRPALCKRWRLALAAGAAESGDHREAGAQMEAAVGCGADGAYDRAESLVIGYIGFLRSAAYPRKTDRKLRPKLDRIVRRRVEATCVGLADFGHRFTEALPDEIAALASRLTYSTRPSGEMLSIRSSRDRLNEGVEALKSAKQATRSGDFETAADHLAGAGEGFEAVTHAPGLAQVDFLESLLVADPADDVETKDETPLAARSPSGEKASECRLEQTPPPSTRASLRCLLAKHPPAELAERWSEVPPTELSPRQRRHLAVVYLLADRLDRLEQLNRGSERADRLSVCRYPSDIERVADDEP